MSVTNTQISNRYLIIAAGTFAAIALAHSAFDEPQIIPTDTYKIDFAFKQSDRINISLKHEIDQKGQIETVPEEKLVDMPVTQRIRIKIGQVTPLVFTSVEDEEGFI